MHTNKKIYLKQNVYCKKKKMITATYTCEKCGMSVKSQCAKCDTPLKNKTITTDHGDKVQVSYCPDCDGMIKSPMCCGNDMSCEI